MTDAPRLGLIVSDTAKAQLGAIELRRAHDWVELEEADVFVVASCCMSCTRCWTGT